MRTFNKAVLKGAVLTVLACLTTVAQTDSLSAGIYQVKLKGELKDLYQITQAGDTLLISVKQGGTWKPAEVLRPMAAQDIAQMLGGMGGEGIKRGYMAPGISIFVGEPGFKMANVECNTGYMAFSMLGPIELHKKEECEKKK